MQQGGSGVLIRAATCENPKLEAGRLTPTPISGYIAQSRHARVPCRWPIRELMQESGTYVGSGFSRIRGFNGS